MIGAKVNIDGKPSMIGVAIHKDGYGTRYKTHKVLLPGGVEITLSKIKKQRRETMESISPKKERKLHPQPLFLR